MIAQILNDLYEDFAMYDGEDRGLMWSESDRLNAQRAAGRYAQMNRARGEDATWDGLLVQAVYEANAEVDPNLKTDALLRVAATALSFAASVQEQTDALNAAEEETEEDSE